MRQAQVWPMPNRTVVVRVPTRKLAPGDRDSRAPGLWRADGHRVAVCADDESGLVPVRPRLPVRRHDLLEIGGRRDP